MSQEGLERYVNDASNIAAAKKILKNKGNENPTSEDIGMFLTEEFKKNKKQLIVPYTLDNNDMRFATNQGFNSGDQFFTYLKDSFDALYEEGDKNPKMMSIGLHCRLIGKPGRIQSLKRVLDYIQKFNDIWICKRIDIAKHWIKNYS